MADGPVLFESCVDSVAGAVASAAGGAGRVELCAHLAEGGATPPLALVRATVAAVTCPVFVMVRPRRPGFDVSGDDVRAMVRETRAAAAAGAAGLVVGAVGPDRRIDAEAMRRLIDAARPLPVTCHRAIDATRDPIEALETLVALGTDRVLTSGGRPTAREGAATIAALVRHAGGAIVVMAGGSVRASNVADLVRRTGVREVHAHLTAERPGAVRAGAAEGEWQRRVAGFVAALAR